MNLKSSNVALFAIVVLIASIGGIVAGATMDHGPSGPTGPAGPTGATGSTGSTGGTGPRGPAGSNGVNGTNGMNGRNGTDYPYPLVSQLVFGSSNSSTYIQANSVNASAPGALTINIQPHASYSATWTTINQVTFHDLTMGTGNTYSVTTSCIGPSNGHCYIGGTATNWAVAFSATTAFKQGASFTLTIIGSDSTGVNFQAVYTVTF